MTKFSKIGIIGLGVMGRSLCLNFVSKNIKVSIYDINKASINSLHQENPKMINVSSNISDLVSSLISPKVILLMINAGEGIDILIEKLKKNLKAGDIIIDGGNSNYKDTIRRYNLLQDELIEFLGMGISGGEKGALLGPSLMVGGSKKGWLIIKEMFQKISAKFDGNPCCRYLGPNGVGHYVKMIHNGIEYGIMELIAEFYDFMKRGLKYNHKQINIIFQEWNKSEFSSYLIEITGIILNKFEDDTLFIELINDMASQKGTGGWTAINSIEMGIPSTIIIESVLQRSLSFYKKIRVEIAKKYNINNPLSKVKNDDLTSAMFGSLLLTYIQGFEQINYSKDNYNWEISSTEVLKTWKSGCIIQSNLLSIFERVFENNNNHLLLNPILINLINPLIESIKNITAAGIYSEIPMPGLSSALNYFYSFNSSTLPANLIQAQRDFFGSHGFSRIDKDENKIFHLDL